MPNDETMDVEIHHVTQSKSAHFDIGAVVNRAISGRVAQLLAFRDMKQVELSRRSGVRPSWISRLMTGKADWLPHHIGAVAAALGVSPRDLLPGEDDLEDDELVDQVDHGRRPSGNGATRVIAGDEAPRDDRRLNPSGPMDFLSEHESLILKAMRRRDLAEVLHVLTSFARELTVAGGASSAPSAPVPSPAAPAPSAEASALVDQVDLQAPLPSPSEPPVEAPAARKPPAPRAKK
jgi:transcriptional regulator with XRE-family HTH domain